MLRKSHFIALATMGLFFGSNIDAADNINPTNQESVNKSEDMKKLSEAFGNVLGSNLKSSGIQFNIDDVLKGIRNGFEGKPSPLTEKEFEEMLAGVQERAMKAKAESNLKAANEFMERNSKVAGVKQIVPGKLDYQVLKEGDGAVVEAHSSPQIHYTGKYQDGTEFGSSKEMGGPITIPLDQTIPGFSKGIVGMKEGEKRRLFVHPDLGYGTSGQLPPNELLIFDVEVVKAHSDDKHESAMNDQNNQQGFPDMDMSADEADDDFDDEDDNDDDDHDDDHDDEDDFHSHDMKNSQRSQSYR